MFQDLVHEAMEGFVFFGRCASAFGFRLDKRAWCEFGAGVPDQGAGGLGSSFEMELKSDGASNLEGLVFAGWTAGQMGGAGGKVEGFAMPLEDLGRGGEMESGRISMGKAPDGEPADFLFSIGEHARSQGAGDELGAETDAEHGFAGLEKCSKGLLLGGQPGVEVFIVDAHGAAEDHQEVGGARVGDFVGVEQAGIGDLEAGAQEVCFDVAQTFERDVLPDTGAWGGFLHGSFSERRRA